MYREQTTMPARQNHQADARMIRVRRRSFNIPSRAVVCGSWMAYMPVAGIMLVSALLVIGCTTVRPTREAHAITPDMLLEARPIVADGELADSPNRDVLVLDDEMLRFLDRFVDADQSDRMKLRQLLSAIMDEGSFGLVYDTRTRTAAETFHERRGNCLSFTNMFVAMARRVGIDARFQEVDIPPDWTVLGGAFVLNRHVNVFIELQSTIKHIVDFNIDDFRASYDRRQVPDRRALAHYYNNIGVERMAAGDTIQALLHFRIAIEKDRRFSPAWGNLGTLYRRNGLPAYAEAAYIQALDTNPRDLVAMSNLAALYRQQGDAERADAYRRRVEQHRITNPYYRFRLASNAYRAGDYDASIAHLKFAIRKKDNEDAFYSLMGLNHLKKGDEKSARRWLERAVRVAEDAGSGQDSYSKLEKLLSSQD
jgi:Flp pilus assembly protein TadD